MKKFLNKTKNFNLLKPINANLSTIDRVYLWLNTRIRLIVLIVYIFTIISFIFKIIEDTNAKNLDRIIQENNSKLLFFGEKTEPSIRKIHKKEYNYQQIWNNSHYVYKILQEIYGFTDTQTANNIAVQIINKNVFITLYDNIEKLSNLERLMKTNAFFIDKSSVKISDLLAVANDLQLNNARVAIIANTSDNVKRSISFIR